MRNVLGAAIMLSLSFALPAAAAPCPGIVVLQDSFATANPALDATANAQSKVAIQGGKAEVTFLQPAMGRDEEYTGIQYGDVNVCGTFATAKTDKAENQAAGLIFWGTDYTTFYSFQIQPTVGQYAVLQLVPGTGWALPLAWTASTAIVKDMGATNTLMVQTQGKTVSLFINGQKVGTFTGTPPPGGGVVGFSVSTSTPSLDTWDVSDFSVGVP